MQKSKKIFIVILLFIVIGFCIPQHFVNPVEFATISSYNKESFWFYPWGKSGVHKGVDIFAVKGTNVLSSTYGFVIFVGKNEDGGNIVEILGPKWRLHYYAHLNEIKVKVFSFVKSGSLIGSVGNTGNAVGKSPHLHYSIKTVIPYFWLAENKEYGLQRMFYLNPITYIEE